MDISAKNRRSDARAAFPGMFPGWRPKVAYPPPRESLDFQVDPRPDELRGGRPGDGFPRDGGLPGNHAPTPGSAAGGGFGRFTQSGKTKSAKIPRLEVSVY